MNCKANIQITIEKPNLEYKVVLIDVDPLFDDNLNEQIINTTSLVEFFFNTKDTGEHNPELQILIYNSNDEIIYKSEINNELSSFNKYEKTGFTEKTTIEFQPVSI
jgi:hypothetical protein